MALTINNIAFNSPSLSNNQNSLGKSLQSLSSGLRINQASDDAAGLQIAAMLSAEEASLQQNMRNIGDAMSVTNIAEGGLSSISSLMTRGKELAVQASNGFLNDSQRSAIQSEFQNIKDEIDRISEVTNFNGQKLLDGSLDPAASANNTQVGTNNTSSDQINLNVVPQMNTASLGIDALDLSTASGAQSALDSLDSAFQLLGNARGDVGAIQGRLQSTLSNLEVSNENIVSAKSTLQDQDMAQGFSEFNRQNILSQAGYSALGKTLQNQQMIIGNLLNTKA